MKHVIAVFVVAALMAGCGAEAELPKGQQEFLDVIAQASDAYGDTTNEIVMQRERESRGKALCDFFGDDYAINGWVGEVERVASAGESAGLDVAIGERTQLNTASTSLTLTEEYGSTLIPDSSPLYEVIARLEEGDRVQVGGQFFADSGADCLREMSLTESGGMAAPEFLFRFTEITPIPD